MASQLYLQLHQHHTHTHSSTHNNNNDNTSANNNNNNVNGGEEEDDDNRPIIDTNSTIEQRRYLQELYASDADSTTNTPYKTTSKTTNMTTTKGNFKHKSDIDDDSEEQEFSSFENEAANILRNIAPPLASVPVPHTTNNSSTSNTNTVTSNDSSMSKGQDTHFISNSTTVNNNSSPTSNIPFQLDIKGNMTQNHEDVIDPSTGVSSTIYQTPIKIVPTTVNDDNEFPTPTNDENEFPTPTNDENEFSVLNVQELQHNEVNVNIALPVDKKVASNTNTSSGNTKNKKVKNNKK